MACPLSAAAKAQGIPAARAAVATSRLLPEHVRSDQDRLVRALNPRSEQAIRRSVPLPHVQRVASTRVSPRRDHGQATGRVHEWMDGWSSHRGLLASHRVFPGRCVLVQKHTVEEDRCAVTLPPARCPADKAV